MATLVQGVMHADLPWALMLLGGGLAFTAEVMGISSLAFAIGLYLPVTTSASLILGGLVSGWVKRQAPTPDRYQQQHERATLFASGLIAGDALMGIGIAGLVVSGLDRTVTLRSASGGPWEYAFTLLPFAVLAWGLIRVARGAET
jgi:uncharacterized oligopeptide transporter (OPT) family protein